MSCPTCQVAGRRLPSLPLGYVAKTRPRYFCKNMCGIRLLASAPLTVNRISCLDSAVKNTASPVTPTPEDFRSVEEYLVQNPDFLEEFVMKNISQDQIERWMIRKSKKKTPDSDAGNLQSLSHWKFCVHKDKRKLLESLTKDIHQDKNKNYMIYELVKNISEAIRASKHSLYLVDESSKYLVSYADIQSSLNVPEQEIKTSSTISAYVARKKKLVYVTEILGDERFPAGTGRDGTDLSVICYPLCESNGQIYGVVEFVREATSAAFNGEDLEIACSYLTWGSIALHYAEVAHKLETQFNILQFFKQCLRVVNEDQETLKQTRTSILAFGKETTSSENFILYSFNETNAELSLELTDFTLADTKPLEFSIPQTEQSIAGHVVETKDTRNVKNAYADNYFWRTLDQKTGSTTKTVLAAPVFLDGKVAGVVEYLNKSAGVFHDQDEQVVNLCACFCGLVMKSQDQMKQIDQSTNEALVLKEITSVFGKPEDTELRDIAHPQFVVEIPDDFHKFWFNFFDNPLQSGKWFLMIANDLFEKCQFEYSEKALICFTATVKKHYRDMPYHNWEHAFSVAHFMYIVLQNIEGLLPPIEAIALFIGCICHDLDHRGRNNAFTVLTEHPLSKLYESSVLEYHHFYMAKHILNLPECDVLSSFSEERRSEFFGLLENAILATDLVRHFGFREELRGVIDNGLFDWQTLRHRYLASYLMITNADLCGSCKSFEISQISTEKIFEEFYAQGDEELSLGFTPIPMFTERNNIAINQTGFLNGIVKPCAGILRNIVPLFVQIEDQISLILESWEDMMRHGVQNTISEDEIQQLRTPGSELQERSLSFVRYNVSASSDDA